MKKILGSILPAVALAASALPVFAQPVLPYWTANDTLAQAAFIAAAGQGAGSIVTFPGAGAASISQDGGETWRPLQIEGEPVVAAWGSPWSETLYAGTGPLASNSYVARAATLYRSSNGGATWTRLATNHFQGDLIGQLVPGAAPGLVYGSKMLNQCVFTGYCGYDPAQVLVSNDGGDTWRSIDHGITGYTRALYASSDPRTLYVTSSDGLFRSRDGGTTWKQVRPNPSRASIVFRPVAVDRVDPDVLYHYDEPTRLLSVSEDGGDTWRTAPTPEPFDVQPANGLIRVVTDPGQRGRVYLIGVKGRIYESRDAGTTWRVVAAETAPLTALPTAMHKQSGVRTFFASGQKVRVEESPAFTAGQGMWWNPREPGWGLSITQHASRQVFVVWYTYGADGSPTWYFASGGRWTGARTFEAPLYQANADGKPGASFDPTSLRVRAVGEITLAFDDADNATYSYRFTGGLQGAASITRQMVGPSVGWTYPLAQEPSDLWWNATQPGWGVGISQQYGRVFVTVFTYDEAGNPTWWFMPGGQLKGSTPEAYDMLYSSRGTPLGQPYNTFAFRTVELGMGRIAFQDLGTKAFLGYMENGREVAIPLTRQPF